MTKYCPMCKQFNIDAGWSGTDVTPGTRPTINCIKYVWNDIELDKVSEEEFAKTMLTAETCEHFEEREMK